MNLDEMRRLDAFKTYKELEEAKKTIDDLNLRVKHDFETILKFKAENQRLTNKIEQLYEGAEEQRQLIQRLEEAGDNMAEWLEDMRNLGSDACLSHAWREAKEAKP